MRSTECPLVIIDVAWLSLSREEEYQILSAQSQVVVLLRRRLRCQNVPTSYCHRSCTSVIRSSVREISVSFVPLPGSPAFSAAAEPLVRRREVARRPSIITVSGRMPSAKANYSNTSAAECFGVLSSVTLQLPVVHVHRSRSISLTTTPRLLRIHQFRVKFIWLEDKSKTADNVQARKTLKLRIIPNWHFCISPGSHAVKLESSHAKSHRPLCHLFTNSNPGLLFIHSRPAPSLIFFQLYFYFSIKRDIFTCDRELWSATLTFKLYLVRVKMNQSAKYLGLTLKIISFWNFCLTDTQTHSGLVAVAGPLKWKPNIFSCKYTMLHVGTTDNSHRRQVYFGLRVTVTDVMLTLLQVISRN